MPDCNLLMANAENTSELLKPEFLRTLEKLMLMSKKVFRGRTKGERRSPRKGMSLEFSDYKNYNAGDDVRYLDWNAYARLDKLFLKLFMEEEDLSVHVLLDASASLGFEGKFSTAQKIAAAIGYIALSNGDSLSAMVIGGQGENSFRLSRGQGHRMRYLSFLSGLEATGKTHLSAAIKRYIQTTAKPGIMFVISDLLSQDGFENGLKNAIGRGFDLRVVHVMSRSELDPEIAGDLVLIDSETGEGREVSVGRAAIRSYKRVLNSFLSSARDLSMKMDMPYALVRSDAEIEDVLLKALRKKAII